MMINHISRINKHNKQKGATLITALMMLLAMTIIGISAIKMSSIGIIIAGNDQQKLMLMQEADSNLVNLTTPVKLLPPLLNEALFVNVNNQLIYQTPANDRSNPLAEETIVDMEKAYGCEGFEGKAVSVGTPCKLYDFQINMKAVNSGSREHRRRGAGKEVPNTAKYSLINNY